MSSQSLGESEGSRPRSPASKAQARWRLGLTDGSSFAGDAKSTLRRWSSWKTQSSSSFDSVFAEDLDSAAKSGDHCGSRFVVYEASPFRAAWNVIIAVLLLYIGTGFLYRMCFIEFHVPDPITLGPGWDVVDKLMGAVFWVDLVLNFFFTYRESVGGAEVDSLWRIAKKYMSGLFFINLLACTPEELVNYIMVSASEAHASSGSCSGCAGAARMARLPHVTKLTRLARLIRLAKLASFAPKGQLWAWVLHLRGIRILKSSLLLMWIVHILSCGWYATASVHGVPEDTWLARRVVGSTPDGADITLLQESAFVQYCHAWYFILTVFTTVGFGDMSAVNTSEIVYVCFTMFVGAVVHSIVISEVISIVTSVDKTQEFTNKQTELVEHFSQHCEIDPKCERLLKTWVGLSARNWSKTHFDRESMRVLINDKWMPRNLLKQLPGSLFNGKLDGNGFFTCGPPSQPPRLPLLVALSVTRNFFEVGELVYQLQDQATNVFLVVSGVFADIGRPRKPRGKGETVTDFDYEPSHDQGIRVQHGDVENFDTVRSRRSVTARITGRHKDKAAETKDAIEPKPDTSHLFPYNLYGPRSYFGLLETIEGLVTGRRSTVRCESPDGGWLLTLPKKDLMRFAEEFPHFGRAWRFHARRRDESRHKFERRLFAPLDYRDLAAARLQARIRIWLAQERSPDRRRNGRAEPRGADRMAKSVLSCQYLELPKPKGQRGAADAVADAAGGSPAAAAAVARLEEASSGHGRELLQLREELQGGLADLRGELRAGLAVMRSEFAALRQDLLAAAASPASPSRPGPSQDAASPSRQGPAQARALVRPSAAPDEPDVLPSPPPEL